MFPELIDLRLEGVPFRHLDEAHDWATREARLVGERQRIVLRSIKSDHRQPRRWVVLPG